MPNFFYKKTSLSGGFTLIELLVVMAIIGMLSSVVLASLNTARIKSRDAKRLTDFQQIQLALELYYDSNGSYPGINNEWFDIDACSGAFSDLGSGVLSPTYISVTPVDPLPGRCNWYQNRNSGQGYLVTFQPEQSSFLSQDEDCYLPGTWYCVGVNWQ